MKSDRKLVSNALSSLVAVLFTYTAIYYQFPTINVVDLDDYVFSLDIDKKSSALFILGHSIQVTSDFSGNGLLIFERFLALTEAASFREPLLCAGNRCRSPPS